MWKKPNSFNLVPEPLLGGQPARTGNQDYVLSYDGYPMLAKKDQPPPDLKFNTRLGALQLPLRLLQPRRRLPAPCV
jgi:hypothetical protein